MMKFIKVKERLEVTVIPQENLEELFIANAAEIIKFQKIFQK